jgi:NAD(P)-dependent dehydrogenase (short-subunit alcohol dehydrogenase family)
MVNCDSYRLEGKTALVTGSGQGLGREIALAFARNGANLVLADVVYPEQTTRQIEEVGVRCTSIHADVSDESNVMRLAEMAISECGRVDILVNNAGLSQLTYTASEDLSVDEWDRVIHVNLRGTFLCCKHIGRSMIGNGGGNIVNIASTAGISGVPRAPAYCASKAGVILLTKSLALEWARHGIRVNAVAPHYLETELTKDLRNSEKVYHGLINAIPMKRFGKTSEVIGAVLFLCTNGSSFTTGSVISVDGGYLAQ